MDAIIGGMLLSILVWTLCLWTYFFVRIFRVTFFLHELNNLCRAWSLHHIEEETAYEWFLFKFPGFSGLLFSFKPLDLDEWMDKKLVDRLLERNNYANNN